MGSAEFGKEIKQLRLAREIKLREMAARVGISPAYMSRIESGRELPPKGERIVKIAEVLDVPVDDLLSLAGKIDPLIENYITQTPSIPEFLRKMRDSNISPKKLKRLFAELDKK